MGLGPADEDLALRVPVERFSGESAESLLYAKAICSQQRFELGGEELALGEADH